ncbi:MAG: nucleotidyltransferase [Candidatus Paceibacterota bacterium]
MAIPNSQLETWAKQGATVTSKQTHESIRNALKYVDSPIKYLINSGSAEIYLQGSYKNHTNIRGDSDVDVVVELNTIFGHNSHKLSNDQQVIHSRTYTSATYKWEDFRSDVISALENYYGQKYVDCSGNKSIKLISNGSRLNADVVPVIKYRKYSHFKGDNDFHAERGIKLYHRTTGDSIINYPRHHYSNGNDKNSDSKTKGLFKPVVRVFKNMRSYLVSRGELNDGVAPSYFLEGLIYNVPNEKFIGNYSDIIFNVLKYLHENPIDDFYCQNEIHPLFGDEDQRWNEIDAKITINAFVQAWTNWVN